MGNRRSADLFAKMEALIPGGVNSPVRAFGAVGGQPFVVDRAKGCRLYDVDGNEYIDYVGSWGSAIVGHANEEVLAAIGGAAERGVSFGAPCPAELEFAEIVADAVDSIEMVRAVNSGTESTMTAVRLARGHTKRELLVKFDGCYHGHSDALLVKAGSGAMTLGNPSSAGVTRGAAQDTVVLPYNGAQAVRDLFASRGDDIAGVIVEPIAGNMNLVMPETDFLPALRECCDKHGSVLIFDEVMTGFRVARGGVQQVVGVRPDLTCVGKVAGGGLGVAAVGGSAKIMRDLAPLGHVYQAGTLSGNPVALACGLATLKIVLRPGFLEQVGQFAAELALGLQERASEAGVAFCAQSAGAMLGWYMRERPPRNAAEAAAGDGERFRRFFRGMLGRGVYVAPSAFEAAFAGISHVAEAMEPTLQAATETFNSL